MEQIENISNFCREYFKSRFTGLQDAANHYDCSIAFISAVQTGSKPPSKRMQDDMGITAARVVIYLRKGEE